MAKSYEENINHDKNECLYVTKHNTNNEVTYGDIAARLLKDNLLLTALELHTELVEAGTEVPKLKEFFSNPGNFEQQAPFRPELLTSIQRSSSQATLDSLDLTRYSEDGERGVDERVAVLEFELRKAKETISALRANLTVATESETTTPDAGSCKLLSNESIKPHEQRALNFLINEYLLSHGYKLTSITFADENENQDFEDWDDVGLNIPKPAELLSLYRDFMRQSGCTKLSCQHASCQTDEDVDCLNLQLQLQNSVLEIEELQKQIRALQQEKQELQDRIWDIESRTEGPLEPSLTVELDNISTHSTTPDHFELIEAGSKAADESVEDTECSRVEDDESTGISLADTDAEWTRVGEANNYTPVGSQASLHNLAQSSVLLSSPVSRAIPAAFQSEVLSRCFVNTFRQQDGHFLEEMLSDGISQERLVYVLAHSLPRVIPNVILNKREELVPLIICTIHLHPDAEERDRLLHLLFNLKKRPQEDERRMILAGIVGIAQCSGLNLVENEILPQCWEQINHRHVERRMLVAESCSALAPYVSSSIRNSLMLSMLQQMLLEDKDESVREVVIRSLALIVTFMDNKDKYLKCEELALAALDDLSPNVVSSATCILLPVLAKWSLGLCCLQSSLYTRLLYRLKSQVKATAVDSTGSLPHHKDLDRDQRAACTVTVLQTLLPYLLVAVACVDSIINDSTAGLREIDPSSLFDVSNSLINPSVFCEEDLMISRILGVFHSCRSKDWPEFNWLFNKLVPEVLCAVSETEESRQCLVISFIKFFHCLCYGFGEDVKEKVKLLFTERLQQLEKCLTNGRESAWPPLSLIPVYSVGVLAPDSCQKDSEELAAFLKKFLCALPLCGAPLNALRMCVQGLCEEGDTVRQEVVLAALWEGVVHPRPIIRHTAATLFGVAVEVHVADSLVASRIVPALVTLASDPEMSVRTATVPAFGNLITHTTIREVHDKTYMQLQSLMSDPTSKDHHPLLVQLVITLGNVVASCDSWFREEVVLPQLAATAAYTLHLSNQTRKSDMAEALVEAFSTAVYCSLSKQTISNVLLPGLRYLELINIHHDTVVAMIRGAESRIEPHRPMERSGSMSLAAATANVGQGVEDMKQRMSKIFQNKHTVNRPANLPHIPNPFRKK